MSQFKTFKNSYFSQIYVVSALYLFNQATIALTKG